MVKRAIVLPCLLAAMACSGSSSTVPSSTTVGGVPITTNHGSMSATIDGVAWNASTISTATFANGIVSIGGAEAATPTRTIALAVNTSSPGTFTMGQFPGVPSGVVTISPSFQTWTAGGIGGSGTVTITTLSSTGTSGTFSFTAVASASGATGNKVVTNGTFNITF